MSADNSLQPESSAGASPGDEDDSQALGAGLPDDAAAKEGCATDADITGSTDNGRVAAEASMEAAVTEEPGSPSGGDAVLSFGYPLSHMGGLATVLAVLALLGTLVGRSLAPALPGTAAGIEYWIQGVEVLGALLSVHFFVGASLAATWLSLLFLMERRLPLSLRMVVVPSVAIVQVLAIAGYRVFLFPGALLWISIASASLAFASAPRTVTVPRTRALGVLLFCASVASVVDVASRVMAIRASEQALDDWFFYSRVLASLTFLTKVFGLLVVSVWLGRWSVRRQLTLLCSTLVVGALVAVAAMVGLEYSASFALVWLGRAMAELTRIPYPLFLPLVRLWVEALNLAFVVVLLVYPGRPRALASAAALILLSFGATDIPICALMLTVAALIVSLESLAERGPAAAGQ